MIQTFFILVVSFFAVFIAIEVADIPGEVLFIWEGWRVVAPIPILFLSAFTLGLVLILIFSLWRGLWIAPARLVAAYKQSRQERGYRALTQGMVAVAAGDANEARRQAKRAEALSDAPPLTMLLAAQAAQLQGEEEAATAYFRDMLKTEETAFLGLRGLLIQAQKSGNNDEALKLAARAHRLKPKTSWVLNTMYDLHTSRQNWVEASRALDGLVKIGIVKRKVANRRKAAMELIKIADAKARGDEHARLAGSRVANKLSRDWVPSTIGLAETLADLNKTRQARRLIEKSWVKTPHPDLLEVYGSCLSEDNPIQRLNRIERLVAKNPSHRESRVALAEAMIEANLWGPARIHLVALLEKGETVNLCRLMAKLEEAENKESGLSSDWLRRIPNAIPDARWCCGECDHVSMDFLPNCPGCRSLGSFEWREGAESSHLARKDTEISDQLEKPKSSP